MTFDDVFQAFYTLYRAESDVPASTDDEYTIAMRLANEAINWWASYDGTYWNELWTTPQEEGDTTNIVTGTTQYDVPDNFKEPGGDIKILDSNGNTARTYKLIEPDEAQFRGDHSHYAFFSGSPAEGYLLNLNPAPDSSINGMQIKFAYYKTPTLFTVGADVTEMRNPYFIVHRILANRFRASMNPYYQDALRDAENILRIMQLENNAGTPANPIKVTDKSGSTWGG